MMFRFFVLAFLASLAIVARMWSGAIISEVSMYALMLTAIVVLILITNRNLSQDAFQPFSYLLFTDFTILVMPLFVIEFAEPDKSLLQYLPNAALMVAISFLLVWFGYSRKIGRAIAIATPLVGFPKQQSEIPWSRILVLYAIAWIARSSVAQVGFSHIPDQEVAMWRWLSMAKDLGFVATLCFVLLSYHLLRRIAARNRISDYAYLVSLTLAEIIAGLFYGGRTAIIMPLLLIAFCYSFAIRPIRWRTLLAAYMCAFIVLGPIITSYRGGFYDAVLEGGVTSRQDVVSLALDSILIQGNVIEEGLEIISHRTATLHGLLRVVERVPTVYDYEMGATFMPQLATVFIPRILWPDKPIYLTGRYFNVMFWDSQTDFNSVGTSNGISLPGEAYFNFGWVGLLGMILVGVVLRILWEREKLYAQFERYGGILRRHFTLFTMASMTGMIGGYVSGSIRTWLVYLLFFVILHLKLPKIIRTGKITSGGPSNPQVPMPIIKEREQP